MLCSKLVVCLTNCKFHNFNFFPVSPLKRCWKDFLGFMVINFIQCKCLLINRANVFIRNVKSDLFYWTLHTWALSALKTYLGYLWFTSIFIKSGQDLKNRLVSSSSTFQSSYDFYIFFHFEVWVISWARHIAGLDRR